MRRAAFPLATFVQAVVISALLLAFGLGVDRSIVLPRQDSAYVATPIVHKVQVSEEAADDMLSGYKLAHYERQPAVRRGGNIR